MSKVQNKPDKTDLLAQVDDDPPFYWPFCIMPWCDARICWDLSDVYCFLHSCEMLNVRPHFETPWMPPLLAILDTLE